MQFNSLKLVTLFAIIRIACLEGPSYTAYGCGEQLLGYSGWFSGVVWIQSVFMFL